MEGPEAGRVYQLSQCVVTFGRSADSDIAIEDSGVSRHHACVGVFGQSVYVEDMGSENGTYVNEKRVRRAQLQSGDLVQLGARVGFSFQWVNGAHLRLIEQLYSASTRDGLTGIYNRRHFQDRLQAEVAFCRRHGTDLGLVMIDIDYFKSINDRHGHPVGDAVLQQLASRIVRQVRTEDIFARIGGEEFAVVLRGINIDGCCRLAERLRVSIAGSPFRVDDLILPVTVSLGCASLSGGGVTTKALIASADARLYHAKRHGRNRVVAA
jgi:diguanylate cyclase (GGDEF)-like protein